jgi:hypothetical protein
VNALDLIPVLLLVLFSLAMTVGLVMAVLAARSAHRTRMRRLAPVAADPNPFIVSSPLRACFPERPPCWLAIRSRNLLAVQSALGLHNPKPCTWIEGLAGEQKLFIAPPVKGWILVIGCGLPDPGDDVDVCFRFLIGLSRKLGHVQYFCLNRVLSHHAWVRAESGRIIRAYAWAGKTLWNQGIKTAAELELGLKCFAYLETPQHDFGQPDVVALNTEKVPALAARWSLDPAGIDDRLIEHAHGIAGEPSRRY